MLRSEWGVSYRYLVFFSPAILGNAFVCSSERYVSLEGLSLSHWHFQKACNFPVDFHRIFQWHFPVIGNFAWHRKTCALVLTLYGTSIISKQSKHTQLAINKHRVAQTQLH